MCRDKLAKSAGTGFDTFPATCAFFSVHLREGIPRIDGHGSERTGFHAVAATEASVDAIGFPLIECSLDGARPYAVVVILRVAVFAGG